MNWMKLLLYLGIFDVFENGKISREKGDFGKLVLTLGFKTKT